MNTASTFSSDQNKTSMTPWQWFLVLFSRTAPSMCHLVVLYWTPYYPSWCSYNLSEHFSCLLWFITFIMKGIYYFVEKYTFKRVCVYIIFITTVSFGLVYLLHCSMFNVRTLFDYGIKQKLDETLIDLPSVLPFDSDAKKHRYEGESVTFTCTYMLTFDDCLPFLDQVQWMRGSTDISKTSHYHIDTHFRKMKSVEGLFFYEAQSILHINRVGQLDFRKYSCGMRLSALFKQRRKLFEPFDYGIWGRYSFLYSFRENCEFELICIPPKEIHVQAPPGAILITQGKYREYSDEISMRHTINDIDYTDVCPGTFSGCSKFALLYLLLYHGKSIDGLYFGKDLSDPVGYMGLTMQCVCLKAYGHHEIQFQRPYYNHTTKRKELLEETYAITYLVTPMPQTIFPPRENETTHLTLSLGHDCWTDNTETQSNVCLLVKKITQLEKEYLFTMEYIIFIFGIMFFCFTVFHLYRFMLLHRFIIPIRNLILEGSFIRKVHGEESMKSSAMGQGVLKHDTYISHCDSQEEIAQELATTLKTSGISVFCTSSILPGHIIVSAMAEAISVSRKMIVLLSPDYLNNDISCYEFKLLLEAVCNDIDIRDILVLKCNPCDLPSELCRSYHCLDWPTDLVTICNWIAEKPKQNVLRPPITLKQSGRWSNIKQGLTCITVLILVSQYILYTHAYGQ